MDEDSKKPEPPSRVSPGDWSPQFVNAMSHLYRGELGRIMIWRQRLDTTTTWAIGATTTIISIAFTTDQPPDLLLVVNMIMVWILLWIEARRYRFYDAFRARVRMIEAHFYVPILKPEMRMLEGDWRDLLCEDMLIPSFKMSIREALGRRLQGNYMWLYGMIFLCWITKIFMHSKPRIDSLSALYRALGYEDSLGHQIIPPWIILVLVLGFYGFLGWLLANILQKGAEEVGRPNRPSKRWKI